MTTGSEARPGAKGVTVSTEGFPLSPLQAGMLFHAISGGVPGVDVEQILCTLTEPLDVDALRAAWATVVGRHDPLRTYLVWEGLDHPQQVTAERSPLDFRVLDGSQVPEADQQEGLEAFLRADRREAFELSRLPLMRVSVLPGPDRSWRCLWTFHHVLLDGRSFPVILGEVFDLYEAFREGRDAPEWDRGPGYRGFIDWLGARDPGGSESFWRETLAGFTAPTPVPLAGLVPSAEDEEVLAEELRLPAETAADLSDFAESRGLTLNTLIQGTWALLLHHYTGEDDVVFAATRACRRSVDGPAADAVGLLINTLPMRARILPDDNVVGWLQRLRAFQVALRDHEHTALADVRRWSEVASGRPLFETLVIFERYLLDSRMRSQGGSWESRHFRYIGQTNFPLALIAYADDGLLFRLEYRTTLFDAATAKMMLTHVAVLLKGLAAHPDAHPAEVPYTSAEEREREPGGAELRSFPVRACVHTLFERQAADRPASTAVVFEDAALTYGELDARADRLAEHLRSLGVGRDTLVGLLVGRSAELVVAILGVLKAGGAYVPIDPAYPAERVAYIVEDANVRVLVAQHGLVEELPSTQASVVYVDDPEGWTAQRPESPPEWAPPDPDSLAYVIYTSGSTGRPKGVEVTHANVVRLLHATAEWFDFGPDDVWTLFHSYAFDFSVWEIWGSLAFGGRLVVVPYLVSRSPEDFFELLVRERVTVLNQTPSAFLQLSPVATRAGEERRLDLRCVVFGGEALDPPSLRPWVERYGVERPRLVNMYGITETTVHVTYRQLVEEDILGGARSVIGAPLPDLSLLVLDAHGRRTPVGVAGELHVGGAGLARGYLNRPELTAERFVVHPLDPNAGRVYRTGDLVRRLPDGDLEYLGRIDDQVKVRGFRIELGEIEVALAELRAISHSAVVVREDEPGHRRLVGYYVPAEGAGEDGAPHVLRGELAKRLPEHMVPSVLVPMEVLPLTANGKVDRKALPSPPAQSVVAGGHRPPRTDVERLLAEVWEEVLGLTRVGIDDDFYDVGGDSIISIQIVSRARSKGLALNAGDVLLHTTIAELTAAGVDFASPPSTVVRESGVVELTPIQSWFFELDLANVHDWSQWLAIPLTAGVDEEVLAQALRAVVAHHDTLRLRFTHRSAGWSQAYLDEVPEVDLERTARTGPDEDLASSARAMQLGLNLTDGPVFRAAVVGVDRERHLVLVAHHLVIDGVSWRILLEDLDAAYHALDARTEPDLPPSLTSYGSWSRALAAYADDPRLRQETPHWRALLDLDSGASPPPAGTGPNLESTARTVRSRLSSALTSALLTDVHRAYGTRINDVLLTAFAKALAEIGGAREAWFDLEGHGREPIDEDLDLSRTLGWFTSIFPVRLVLPEAGGAGDELVAVKEQLRATPRNGIGYGVLRYGRVHPDRELGGPGPRIAFNYLGQTDRLVPHSALFAASGASIETGHDPEGTRPYDLEVIAEVLEGALTVRWIYSDQLHDAETVRALAGAFETSLRTLIEHCIAADVTRATPSDFPRASLTQDELDGVLDTYPDASDICPLSPMQELYHGVSLAAPALGHEHWHFTIEGPLSPARLRRAWESVVHRHGILRSAFVTEGLRRPLRLTLRSVEVPWKEVDLSPSPDAEADLARILEEEEARAFELHRPPLTGVTLVHRADGVHEMIWSTHHLVIDGWSWPVVLADLVAAYRDEEAAQAAPTPPDYGVFIDWMSRRRGAEERTFWTSSLAGFVAPHRLGGRASERATPMDVREAVRDLSPEVTATIVEAAQVRRVTLGTFVQGAWAVLLSAWTGEDDVVFGAAHSGRPAELAGVEGIVGPFVNNLPVRARLIDDEPLSTWLTDFHRRQIELGRFQHTPLREIHEWSEVPSRMRLFESLVVVQNYSVDLEALELGPTTRLRARRVPQETNYPLTIVATPGERLRLAVMGKDGRWSEDEITSIADALERTLVAMSQDPEAPLASLRGSIEPTWLDEAQAPQEVLPTRVPDRQATHLEGVISEVLGEAFDGVDIGLYDNFFDLGAHSLLLLSIHQKLEEQLGRSFPVTDVFEFATVAALAEHLGGPSQNRDVAVDLAEDRAQRMREGLRRRARRRK